MLRIIEVTPLFDHNMIRKAQEEAGNLDCKFAMTTSEMVVGAREEM